MSQNLMKPLMLLFLCLHPSLVVGARWFKRDDPSPPFATVDIPLSFSPSGKYIVSVGMGSGSGLQNFNFTLSTGTGYTAVASEGCSDCNGASLYNMSKSTTATSDTGSQNITVAGEYVQGSLIKENCFLRTSNGSSWNYLNQTIVSGSSQSALFDSSISGLVGLGTNRVSKANTTGSTSPQFDDSIYYGWLVNHPTASNFSYGMKLSPPISVPKATNDTSTNVVSGDSSAAGVLHWVAPDQASYDASRVAWSSTQTANASQEFTVQLDAISISGNSVSFTDSHEVLANVDSLYPAIYMPLAQANVINLAIAGSTPETLLSTSNGLSFAYAIPCDSQYSFTVTVGSQNFTADQSNLLIRMPDGTCTSGFETWFDSSVSTYTLGANFLSTVYLMFIVPRNGTDMVGFAPRVTPSKSNHAGAIAGGVVGGVVGAALIAFAAFYFYRRRRLNRPQGQFDIDPADKLPGAVEPYTVGVHSSTPTNTQTIYSEGTDPQSRNALLGDVLEPSPPAYEASESRYSTPSAPRTPRDAKTRYMAPDDAVGGEGSAGPAATTPQSATFSRTAATTPQSATFGANI